MQATAVVFPLLPGKREALRLFLEALEGEWKEEHDRTHSRISNERWFVQALPEGEIVIVYLEGNDPSYIFADLAVSQGEFEVWFREQALDITGVNLELLPPFSVPECVLTRAR